jgi:hypothetical protein
LKNNVRRSHKKRSLSVFFVGIVVAGLAALLLVITQVGRPAHPMSKFALTPSLNDHARIDRSGGLPDVRGVYLPAAVAANTKKLQEILENSRRIGFNAIVIDIKDNHGTVAYDSKTPLTQEIGARVDLLKLDELVPYLKKLGFYVIARQVLFYDPKLATHFNALNTAKEPHRWVSPADDRVQEYNLAIAEEAAAGGFDELQFDYIRWPDGGAYQPIYTNRYEAMKRFLERVHQRLHLQIRLSADVFGRTLWSWNTKKIDPIGQHLETFAEFFDALSPMIYPSHYETEELRADPYGTVKKSLESGLKRQLPLRPFVQAFEMRIPRHLSYTQYIRAQVRATRDMGITSYLFWNPKGDYSALWRALSEPSEAPGETPFVGRPDKN